MVTYGFQDKQVALRLKEIARQYRNPGQDQDKLTFQPGIEELVRFKNSAEESCPGGAVILIDAEEDDDTEGIVTVIKKPTKEFKPYGYLVNIDDPANEIEQDEFGWAVRLNRAGWVLAEEPSESSPTKAGQLWGPKDGEWKLFQGMTGFQCTGFGKVDEDDSDKYLLRAIQSVQPAKVQCWDSDGATLGKLLQPNTDRVIKGRVLPYDGSASPTAFKTAAVDLTNCWIKFIDFYPEDSNTNGPLGVHGRFYDAYPAGYIDISGEARALYLAEAGPQVFLVKTDTARTKGSTPVSFKLYNRDRSDSTFTRDAIPLGADIPADKWATVRRFDDGAWYAGCWES